MVSIEEHIRKAAENGDFDDLPGKGKPLNLSENPLEDPDWRLAHHILQSNGFSLPWIENRRNIETDMAAARAGLASAWAVFIQMRQIDVRNPEAKQAWQRAVEQFQHQAAEINQRILTYNLSVPLIRFQMFLINADTEIAQLTTANLDDTL